MAGSAIAVVLGAGPALACGGLIGPKGTVNLVRTSTLAAYHDGIEHYVTAFEFAGGEGKFGSIVPLPGLPTEVKKAGRWTLQRLRLEVGPEFEAAALVADQAAGRRATVHLETQVDALDITVLEGGGDEVGRWAKDNGFALPPDAPEVLDFYAARSPIFMAVRFNLERAADRGLTAGDGIPVHVVIPTDSPWVPLRILALGKQAEERVEADVFLLTDRRPNLLPRPGAAGTDGLALETSAPASEALLEDLRSDRGMRWLPRNDMWLTYLSIDVAAGALTHDLAIDATGFASPDPVDAGLALPVPPGAEVPGAPWWPWVLLPVAAVVGLRAANSFISTR